MITLKVKMDQLILWLALGLHIFYGCCLVQVYIGTKVEAETGLDGLKQVNLTFYSSFKDLKSVLK